MEFTRNLTPSSGYFASTSTFPIFSYAMIDIYKSYWTWDAKLFHKIAKHIMSTNKLMAADNIFVVVRGNRKDIQDSEDISDGIKL